MTLQEKVIECALSAVGVTEDKPYRNRGKWVDVYTRFLGLLGVPWCACFVAYKIHQAAKLLGVKAKWPRAAWAGSCDSLYAWAKKTGNIISEPVAGCVFLVGTPADYTHTGFVAKVRGVMVETVEGNTNDDGSREGYAVCKRARRRDALTFIKIV